MKKALIILSLLAINMFGCKEDGVDPNTDNPVVEEAEAAVDKKGVGMTYNNQTWSTRIARMKAYWHYSWGRTLKEHEPENVEFVPMFWGKNSVTDAEITRLKQLASEGKIKYILGFNEPDGVEQANMTVDEAIALWPRLEEIGLPLGSPATVNPENEWMTEFMQKAKTQNLRIDFVCVHNYGGNNPTGFLNKLKNVFDTYGKPIWITEFAIADWSATSPEDNKYTAQDALSFMKAVLPKLYEAKYIHRFAWFNASPTNRALAPSVLFDADDNLTTLGQFYANYEPNPIIGAGFDEPIEVVEEVEGNILVNGTFETGEITPWLGFKNSIVAVASNTHTGGYCGRIENNDGSLYQVVTLEPGKTYALTFFSRWSITVSNTFNMAMKSEVGDKAAFHTFTLPKSAEWTESKTEFTVPAAVTSARVLFYKPKVDPAHPSFFLDDIVRKEKI